MAHLHWHLYELLVVFRTKQFSITWNLLLAAVPALLAVGLFRPDVRHTAGWWAGVGAFAVFLPNAPYVVTDLVHLPASVANAPTTWVVLFGVLPMYAAFITAGFVLYAVSIHRLVAEVRRRWPAASAVVISGGVHAACAVGVVLGRVARLNSWDTVATPIGTLERSMATLTWRGAPIAVVVVFIVITLGYAVTSALLQAMGSGVRRLLAAAQPAV